MTPEPPAAAPERAQVADLLWGRRKSPSRGPKPSLSLARIVEVGIELADAEGLAALSMQRIADELGYTKMSLYRYTPGKAELVALMLDSALGAPPDVSAVPGDWRAKLRAWAVQLWDTFNRRPWAMEVAVGARVFGPNELGWMESGLECLAGLGLRPRERLDAIVVINGHVRTLVQQTVGVGSDTPERDLSAVMAAILAEHGADYPEVTAAFAADDSGAGQDDALDFGLERIFDGLAVLVDRRSQD